MVPVTPPPARDAGRHMLKGSLGIFLAEGLIIPTGFITAVFLTRMLGPTNYGLFTLCTMLIFWIEWLTNALFGQTAVKYISHARRQRDLGETFVFLHVMAGSGVAVIVWLTAGLLADTFREPAMQGYLRLYAVHIPLTCLAGAHSSYLIGRGDYRARAHMGAGHKIARLVLILGLIALGLSVEGAIIAMIGATSVQLLIGKFYSRLSLLGGLKSSIPRLWDFALPLFLSSLCMRVFRLDIVILKLLGATAAESGVYGAALNLTIPFSLISVSLAPVMLSTINALRTADRIGQAQDIAHRLLRAVLWLFPVTALVASTSTEIAAFIFGDRYLAVGPILGLLVSATLSGLVIEMCKSIFIAFDKPAWTLWFTVPILPMAWTGHFIFTTVYGPLGAAWVTTVCAGLAAIGSYGAACRLIGVRVPRAAVLKCAIIAGAIFWVSKLWEAAAWLLCLKLVVFMGIIFSCLLALGEISRADLNQIGSGIKRWLRHRTLA